MSDVDIRRIGDELGIELPSAYMAILRDNPLAYSRSRVEPWEILMNADQIIALNLSYRKDGWFGRALPASFLWIGYDGGGGDYFLTLANSGAVYYLGSESEWNSDDLDMLESWPSIDGFVNDLLFQAAEGEEILLGDVLRWMVERFSRAKHLLRKGRERIQFLWDSRYAQWNPVGTLSSRDLAGVFVFTTKPPIVGMVIKNYWVFHEEGTVKLISWTRWGDSVQRHEYFGDYEILGGTIRANLVSERKKFEFRIISRDCIHGYSGRRGERVSDSVLLNLGR